MTSDCNVGKGGDVKPQNLHRSHMEIASYRVMLPYWLLCLTGSLFGKYGIRWALLIVDGRTRHDYIEYQSVHIYFMPVRKIIAAISFYCQGDPLHQS